VISEFFIRRGHRWRCLYEEDTRLVEMWVSCITGWWGLWMLLFVVKPSVVSVTQQLPYLFLANIFNLTFYALLLLLFGGIGFFLTYFDFRGWRRDYAFAQGLFWLFHLVIFALADFYNTAFLLCFSCLVMSCWSYFSLSTKRQKGAM